MFTGRTAELNLLEKAYTSNKSELAVIYGRRRIGKSALVEQFLKGKPSFFSFEALEDEKTSAQLLHFTRRLARHMNEPLLEETAFKDWDRAFDYFTRNVLLPKNHRKKYIIFLDELQWMAVGKSSLVGLLKYYWDNHWKQHRLMLILCGSVSSFMIKNVIRSKALYGRTTLEINLKGLQPADAYSMLGKRRSFEEVLRYLLVFGGVPKYLEEIDVHRSFNENMNSICFSKNGSMLKEAEKIFHSQFSVMPHMIDRFREKIKQVRQVSSPGIATLHSFGSDQGNYYLTMELVVGKDLEILLANSHFQFEKAQKLMIILCDILDSIHATGLVHGNLKPRNIIIADENEIKIIDFGLAKLLEPLGTKGSEVETALREETKSGQVLGSVPYMSPEQTRGQELDPRTDIWSLGALLYELTTGQVPFRGEHELAVVYAIQKSQPTAVTDLRPDTPLELVWIITKCLAKDRKDRYRDEAELLQDLDFLRQKLLLQTEKDCWA